LLKNDFITRNFVMCGNLVVPFSSLNERLCQFVRAIIVEQNDKKWAGYLGRTGSSTLIRIGGVNYICLTKHELKGDISLDEIRIVSGVQGRIDNITFDSAIYPAGPWSESEEFSDIVLLHANRQNLNDNSDYVHFFPLKKFERRLIFASLIVACPFFDNNFEVDEISGETSRFHQTTVVRDCFWDPNYKSYAKYVENFNYNVSEDFPENGMSGGSVFSIIQKSDGLEVVLHGIIVRASNGKLKIVSSDFFFNLIEGNIEEVS